MPKISTYLLLNTTVFTPKYHWIWLKYTCICSKYPYLPNIRLCLWPLYFKIFVGQHETRTQHNNIKSHFGGRASSPTLSQCQLGDCQVHLASHAQLSVLGSLFVDIGLKLYSVHLAVKFSSASGGPWFWKTWLQVHLVFVQFQVKSVLKSALLAALNSADLKMDLAGLEPELVKLASLHSAT